MQVSVQLLLKKKKQSDESTNDLKSKLLSISMSYRADVPDLQGFIVRRRHQQVGVGRPGHVRNALQVRRESFTVFTSFATMSTKAADDAKCVLGMMTQVRERLKNTQTETQQQLNLHNDRMSAIYFCSCLSEKCLSSASWRKCRGSTISSCNTAKWTWEKYTESGEAFCSTHELVTGYGFLELAVVRSPYFDEFVSSWNVERHGSILLDVAGKCYTVTPTGSQVGQK